MGEMNLYSGRRVLTYKNDLMIKRGNTEMQNQADFAKSTLNSEINLIYISFPLIMYFLLQIIIMNTIDYLVPASTKTRSQHSLKFLQIPVSSEYYKSSFFPRTVCRWNSLPANVAEAPSLVSFKQELSSLSI